MKHRKRESRLDLSLRTRARQPQRSIIRSSFAAFIAFSMLAALNSSFAVDISLDADVQQAQSALSGNAGISLASSVSAESPEKHSANQGHEQAQESRESQDAQDVQGAREGQRAAESAAPSPHANEAGANAHATSPTITDAQNGSGSVVAAQGDGSRGDEGRDTHDESLTAAAHTENQPEDGAGASTAENSRPNNEGEADAAGGTTLGHSGFFAARQPRATSSHPNDPSILPAVFAKGGAGKHKDRIQWLQWADYDTYFKGRTRPNRPILYPGESKVFKNYRDFGKAGYLLTSCELSDLKHHSRGQGVSPSQSDGPLVATVPGTWAGDILDNLYNSGGGGRWRSGREERSGAETYPDDYFNENQMVIGLANGYAYNGSKVTGRPTGYSSDVEFNIHCTARLYPTTGDPVEVPLEGLVFADAEASTKEKDVYDSSIPGWRKERGEWVQAYAWNEGTTWRLLDALRGNNCPGATTYAAFHERGTTRLLRLTPNGDECVYHRSAHEQPPGTGGTYERPSGIGGPGAVMFMEGSSGASIRMQGSGYSAVAIGLVISTDFGDAPESYGQAGTLFQPQWKGGSPRKLSDDAHFGEDLLAMSADSSPGRGTAIPGAGKSHLGSRIDAEKSPLFDSYALMDDSTAEDDDDGVDESRLWKPGIQAEYGKPYSLSVTCDGPGKVAGWIDWNKDGDFLDAEEKSNEVTCPRALQLPDGSEELNTIMLTWAKVPVDAVRAVDQERGSGPTYMRISHC